MKDSKATLHVQLRKDLLEEIKKYQERRGISKTDLVDRALSFYLMIRKEEELFKKKTDCDQVRTRVVIEPYDNDAEELAAVMMY